MRKIFFAIMVCLCLGITQAQTINAEFLYNEYQEAWKQNNYVKVNKAAKLWLLLFNKSSKHRDSVYAEVENAYAFTCFINFDFENSRSLYQDAYSISPSTISTYHYRQYADTIQTDDSIKVKLLNEILYMEEVSASKESTAYASALINIADFYSQSVPLRAKALYEHAIDILRKNNAIYTHREVVLDLAQVYYSEQKLDLATALLKDLKPHLSPSSHPYLWSRWMMLQNQIYIKQLDLVAAQKHIDNFTNAKSLHPYVDICLKVAQSDIANASRDYALAESIYQSIIHDIDIHVDSLSIKSYATLKLGELYLEKDDLRAAEVLYINLLQQPLTIVQRKSALENLASIYLDLGDLSLAKKFYIQVRDMVSELYGNSHVEYAKILNSLANVAYRQGAIEVALALYMQSIDILLQLDMPHIYMSTLCNIANVYVHQRRYSEAEGFYNQALHLVESTFGTHSADYADVQNNMAIMYHLAGDYKRAYKLYNNVIELRESIAGKDSRKYLESEQCLFNFYSDPAMNIASKATPLLQSIMAKQSYNVRQEFLHLSERQRKEYWNKNKRAFEQIYPNYIYLHRQDTSLCALAYNNELFVKGLLLNTSSQILHAINTSKDPKVKNIYYQLNNNKELLMQYQQTGVTPVSLDSLKKEIEFLDKQLVLLCGEYSQSQEINSINWRTIQSKLSSSEVAIEYFSAPITKDSTMYCALLLRKDSKYPELIPLFEEEQVLNYSTKTIDGEPATNLIYTYQLNEDDTLGYAMHLSKLIWSKILPRINKGETIHFAPSGLLHQLAVEHLPYDENRTMADVYNMVRLSSTREVAIAKTPAQYTSATIYGGITYGSDKSTTQAGKRGMEELLGTKVEAEHINALLHENKITAQLYTSSLATEESFKALSGQHNHILHIGTHGFTWTDSVAREQDYFNQQTLALSGNQQNSYAIDPLNRCGLLFAGANAALCGDLSSLETGAQDGILTAKEISLLHLNDADLVVLSACETAKGDITSEGVFGLQRAFKMAGVQTIIMSLWKVDDEATQLLMTEFYNNWIGKKQSKREAFRNAQNTVRAQHEEPVYWAGFIMLD